MIAPAHAPSAIHVAILPFHYSVHEMRQPHLNMDSSATVDYSVLVVISAITITRESECANTEYITDGHYSVRDALFQQCMNRLKLLIKGDYSLREGRSNRLTHQSAIGGEAIINHTFVRFSGDSELIPTEKRKLPTQSIMPTEQAGYVVAWRDLQRSLESSLQIYFADEADKLIVHYR